jgi:hypothetical protein
MSSLIDISKQWEGRIVDGKFPLQKWLGGSEHSAVFLTERSVDGFSESRPQADSRGNLFR